MNDVYKRPPKAWTLLLKQLQGSEDVCNRFCILLVKPTLNVSILNTPHDVNLTIPYKLYYFKAIFLERIISIDSTREVTMLGESIEWLCREQQSCCCVKP